LRRDIVYRISIVGVLLKVSLRVVEADGPEATDRNVLDVELVNAITVVLSWCNGEVGGILVRALGRAISGPFPVKPN
jgi:hypothetical protein